MFSSEIFYDIREEEQYLFNCSQNWSMKSPVSKNLYLISQLTSDENFN